jgi:diguanylate cyclase (GGDEF)-like protein
LITGQELEIVAHRGLPLPLAAPQRLPMQMLVNIQEVVATRRPLLIDDVSKDARWRWLDVGTTSIYNWLGVPLLAQDQVIGLLNLDKRQPSYYTEHHAEIATAFAAQAAIAIENARLFAETRRMAERQTLLYEALRLVGEQLDPDEVCRVAVETIVRSAHWLSVAISLPIEGEASWTTRAAGGIIPAKFGTKRSMQQGIIGRAYRTSQTQSAPDVSVDPDYFVGHPSVRSELAVPLKRGERILGVLNLESNQLGGFSAEDISLAESIAEAVALALDNARLFEAVQKASVSDGLTGIANRRRFDAVLEREWKRARRLHIPLALLMLDVDCFKLYNDTYGHPAGDDCLRKISAVLTKAAQRPVDLAARYGGEEFVLILPDTAQEGAVHVAEQIQQGVLALHLPHLTSKFNEWLTVSVGTAALIPEPDTEATVLVALADEALYQAKRNRVPRYTGQPAL